MAIAFLVAGGLCIQRPERIAQWLGDTMKGVGGGEAAEAAWLRGRGMILFIRFIGALALLNAVMLLYTLNHV